MIRVKAKVNSYSFMSFGNIISLLEEEKKLNKRVVLEFLVKLEIKDVVRS